MTEAKYDLVIVGAGAAGLIAADFALHLGAKVALVEKDRVGGDCTWTGCVPSKALIKAAQIAHEVRSASRYGITASVPVIDMVRVRDYLQAAIAHIYKPTAPEALRQKGMDVFLGPTSFVDPWSIRTGDQVVHSKKFLIATGARPFVPPIAGLSEMNYATYLNIFDNELLPASMVVIGGGPVGMEIAQAYQRLGSQVTVVADHLLPKEDPDVRDLMQKVFEREGVRFVWGQAQACRREGNSITVLAGKGEAVGEILLIASGRSPNIGGLGLENAGVKYSAKGIPVDTHLRTSAKHIYAAGDVLGGQQFSHFAGWQAFQAVRNALLPGKSSGFTDVLPRVTFTDPEVAQVGLNEQSARSTFGEHLQVRRWPLSKVDRAVCEGETDGFIKILAKRDGTILGATIVAHRAGEAIAELAIAMDHKLKIHDLAGTIHAYPTYSTGIQLLLTEMAVEARLSGASGRIIRGLSEVVR
jgi:pyruvate/2-oxoglutarate dehydrogenase complex dihydrolipoamide dehydrogenase (E3) component